MEQSTIDLGRYDDGRGESITIKVFSSLNYFVLEEGHIIAHLFFYGKYNDDKLLLRYLIYEVRDSMRENKIIKHCLEMPIQRTDISCLTKSAIVCILY